MIDQVSTSDYSAPAETLESKSLRARYTRNFFVIMASNFIFLTVAGFTPDYIMMHNLNMNAHWFSHFHGGLMSLWLILVLVQAVLARRGNLKLHRQLGLLSVGLGVLIWIAMIIVTMRPRIAFPGPVDDDRSAVLLIAIHGFIFFGLFFTWGMLQRKKAAIHKRLMVLATIAVMQGSIDRVVRFLPDSGTPFVLPFLTLDLLLLLPLIVYDLFLLKRIHRITVIGGALLVTGQLLEFVAVGTPTWNKMAFAMVQPFIDPDVPVTLTDAQIAELVGNYGTKEWYCIVSAVDGKLYYKLPTIPNYEIIAVSDSEAFHTKTAWRILFIKDKDGHVLKIINKQPEVVWEINKMSE